MNALPIPQSEYYLYPSNHLSVSLGFYLRLSPEAFHMSHLHICALKCVQALTLLSCSTSLVSLSFFFCGCFFCTYQPFFPGELVWIFIWLVLQAPSMLITYADPEIICFEISFHFSLPLAFPSLLIYFQLGTPGFWCVSQYPSVFT